MKILVTGFEPFGGDDVNASGEAVLGLGGRVMAAGIEVVNAIIPVSFAAGPEALRVLIAEHRPDAVIAVGEAGGRAVVTPEVWAVNDQVARIPDNDGCRPAGPIDDGPPRLGARFDVPGLVAVVREAGVPAMASEDAGRFVCNAVFWAALTSFDGPAGFVHVPAVRLVGEAGVGAETDGGAGERVAGRAEPLGFNDLTDALAAIIRKVAGDADPLPRPIEGEGGEAP